MAIDPLQRAMFRRPGLNIADVTSGILNGIADQPPTQVAGQRLQVASAAPIVFGGAAVNPLAGATNDELLNEHTQLKSLIQQAAAVPPGAERGVYSQVPDLSAQIVRLNMLEKELNSRNVSVEQPAVAAEEIIPAPPPGLAGGPPPPEGDPPPPPEGGPPVDQEDVQSILTAGDEAAAAAVANGQVDPTEAERARAEAEALATRLTQDVETEDDFKQLLATIGPSNIDYTQWKSQAKELLGIDKEEADVPEWAAPMFMFGLKLMQGPVTGKTEGRSLVGGFLGDVGAAGAEAFPLIAVERERKRKQRADIATVTMQLEGADASRKKLIVDAWKAKQTAALKLNEAVAGAFDKLNNRVMGLVPEDQPEKKIVGMFAINSALAQLMDAGVTNEQLLNPAVQSLISTYAANQMGITKTPMKLSSQEWGGVQYAWDPKALEAARSQFNKDNPNNQIPTTVGFLSRLVAQDPSVKQYQSLLIGQRAVNTESKTISRVNANGDTVEDEVLINVTKRNEWMAKHPGADQAAIIAAQPTWRFITETRLKSAPSFTERQFVAENGETIKYYINDAAFDAHQRSDKTLTMQKVLDNPGDYPKIIGGTIVDYSKLQPEMTTIPVGYGDAANQKIMFNYDKRGLAQAINNGTIDPSTGNYIQKIINAGLGNYVGPPMNIKANEMVWTVGPDGSMVSATGQDAVGLVRGIASEKEAALWNKRGSGLAQLHRLSYHIHDFVTGPDGKYVVSGGTDVARFLESGARLISGLFKGGERTSAHLNTLVNKGTVTVGGQTITSGLSSDGLGRMNEALNVLRTGEGLMFGGVAIDTDAKRGQVESMFVNLAFALASAREGGKLTDNDVKNALMTLGWNGRSWTQTPERMIGTLRGAVQEASNSYVTDAIMVMTDENLAKHRTLITEGAGDVAEQLLRRIASASDPDTARIYARYQEYIQSGEDYRLSYHLNEKYHGSPSGTDEASPGTVEGQSSFTYGGKTINYTGESPLTEVDQDRLLILNQKGVERTPAGIMAFLDGISDEAEKAAYTELLRRLRDNSNFFPGVQQ